jgi:hypothetical protein
MPDRRRPLLAIVLLGSLHPTPAISQQARIYQARAEALLPRYREALDQRRRADSLAALATRPDTVRAGSLVLLCPRDDCGDVRPAAESAWTLLERRYGRSLAEVPIRPLFVGRQTGHNLWVHQPIWAGQQVPQPGFGVSGQPFGAGQARLTLGITSYAEYDLWSRSDSVLRGWYPPGPAVADSAELYGGLYYDLVTSPSVTARSCLVGDLSGCAKALLLEPTADPLHEWYDAAGRRELVRRNAATLDRPPLEVELYQCLEERSDASCDRVLALALEDPATRPESFRGAWAAINIRIPTPLGDLGRLTFARVATSGGAPEFWRKLTAGAGKPLGDRLSGATGVPLDSLLGIWRAAVMAARPAPENPPEHDVSLAALWLGIVGLFALRSTRWR